ncbi:hypothetical protein P43SY_003863 [Pythium insidiosum]|uniref:glucan endo-1,3-beta-D-glucosidase n=1 Tax=Pythium insidiosum TaxID=114742 RepID=A0AAD5LAN3_PYTIN|nr:hypothetical protein P43SY_003863 [Pythium insidiosum]
MNGVLRLITVVTTAVLASVNADGVCYDPDHVGVMSKNAESVRADLALIQSRGFSHVRTYISKFGNTDMAAIVAASGLRSALGVPYPNGDYKEHAAAAIKAAQSGTVDYIMVGNENLMGAGAVPGDMIQVINDIKSKVPGNVKVGTVQATSECVRTIGGWDALVAASDVIGVNIHPFFHKGAGASVKTAIDEANAQWERCQSAGGGKLILTETGWPTAGSTNGNQGSLDFAEGYFNAYKSWSGKIPGNAKFYFQMFDQPHRDSAFEQTYGILRADSSTKFAAGGSGPAPAPATSAPAPVPTTPAPTTPAPTTPAPTTPTPTTVTPTVTPAATNKTISHSSSSGSGAGAKVNLAGSSDKEEAGVLSSHEGSDNTEKGTSDAQNESGVAGEAPGAAGNAVPAGGASAKETPVGGDKPKQANTQSGSSSSGAGVYVVASVGCVAVVAAAGFIYKARQKARELEDSERKSSFDSVAITPGGGCVL